MIFIIPKGYKNTACITPTEKKNETKRIKKIH